MRKAAALLALLCLLAAPARADPPKLLILGDSLTAGYGLPASEGFQAKLKAALAARGVAVTLADAAVSGDTSAGGLARLDWALDGSPGVDAALVELGANDGLRGLDVHEMEFNLGQILDKLAARHVAVLLSGMYAPPNMGADYTQSFHNVFDRLGKRPGVLYDPFFLAGIAGDPALNQADGIHPNPEGVRREVARLAPMVQQLLASLPAR
jgi:acyl-CoA thioesterase-1